MEAPKDMPKTVMVNGREIPVVFCETEEIRHPDGRIDLIVKPPTLNLTAKKEN